MKIIYLVDNPYETYGGNRVIFEQANWLHHKGVEVEIWSRLAGIQSLQFKNNVPIVVFDQTRLAEPDIVIVSGLDYLESVKICRPNKPNYFLLQHDIVWILNQIDVNIGKSVQNNLVDAVKNYGLKIIVVSSWLQEVVASKYGLKSTIVKNGIDTELFRRSEKLVKTDYKVVAAICNLELWKGSMHIVSAFEILHKKRDDIRFIMLGRTLPSLPFDMDAVPNFPVPVIYFNEPNQLDIPSIYSSADVFVSASDVEGFGLPVLEAMACGIATVTTDNGGNRDFVKDKFNTLISSNNPEELADKIITLLDNKSLRESLSSEGVQTARSMTWDKSMSDFFKSLQILIAA